MGILQRMRGLFGVKKEEGKKAVETLGSIIAPIFREIPPDTNAGKYLSEGMRSWAYIAMSAIADEVSTSDLEIYRKQGNDWIEVEENQALSVIEKPNQFQTKEELLWLTMMFLLAEGEAPWLLNNDKNPTEIVLLNPQRLKAIYSEDNLISQYRYQQTNGKEKIIEAGNIVFFKFPNYQTPFRGAGIMSYVTTTLDLDKFIEDYLKYFFYNDATPGAVLQTDQILSDPIIKRLRVQFENRHKGVKNSSKMAILEAGLKWQEISSKMNEMQIPLMIDAMRDKILATFKVPKSVLGIVLDVNRANAEASDYTFSRRCILPKLKLIEAQLNQFYLPKFSEGMNLWFEFENPVKEDMEQKARIWQTAIDTGWLTVNEVREEIGLERLDDERYDGVIPEMPDMTPKEEKKEEKKEEPKKFVKRLSKLGRVSRARKTEVKEEKKTEYKEDIFVEVCKDIIKENAPKRFYTENEMQKFHDDKIMFIDTIEADYKDKLEKFFRGQHNRLREQLQGKMLNKKAFEFNFDEEAEAKLMAKVSIPFMRQAIEKESKLAFALIGIHDQLTTQDKVVKDYLDKRPLKLGKQTSETSKNEIERIVSQWTEKEGSWTDLRQSLSGYFDKAEKYRAEMIARTELNRATSFAEKESYKEVGAVGERWFTAIDERVCEFCSEMDGKIININDNFWDNGESIVGRDGGIFNFDESVEYPPLHPNCRCDIVPVFEEDITENIRSYGEYKINNGKRAMKILELEEKEKQLKEKEKRVNELELQAIDEGIKVIKKEEELDKLEKKVEKEIGEIEKFKKEING